MRTSEQLIDLATALSKAQGEIADAEKSSDNPFFGSKYADLAEVLGQIRPIFSENGLSLTQWPELENEGWVGCTTRILHSSGQWMESTMAMPVQGKNVAQDSGSVLTYMRRYMAAAVAGISQVDEDANQAKSKSEKLAAPNQRLSAKVTGEDTVSVSDEKPWVTDEIFLDMVPAIENDFRGGKVSKDIAQSIRRDYKMAKKYGERIDEIGKNMLATDQLDNDDSLPF